MKILAKLKECKNIQELSKFLVKLQPSIGNWGGRRFYKKNQSDSLSLKDLVKRLNEAYQKSCQDNEIIPTEIIRVIGKIKDLDNQANQLLFQKNILIRVLTAIKRWVGNFGFDRNKILNGIQMHMTSLLQNFTRKDEKGKGTSEMPLLIPDEEKKLPSPVAQKNLKHQQFDDDSSSDILIENVSKEVFITLQAKGKEAIFPLATLVQKTSYFNGICSFKEARARKVVLKKDSPEAIQILFSFLETGQADLSLNNVIEGLKIADKYQVNELKDKCQEWILSNYEISEELWSVATLVQATVLIEAYVTQAAKNRDIKFFQDEGACVEKLVLDNSSLENCQAIIRLCPNLKELMLSQCDEVNDNFIEEVAKKLPKLTYLKLEGCYQLTDASIKEVLAKLANLTHLKLRHCLNLTGDFIQVVAKELPNLIHLDLKGCQSLTDNFIQEMAEKLINLTYLNLRGCCKLTDISIKKIAERLQNLTHLNLKGCKQLTDDSITKVAEKLVHLTHLGLWQCEQLTDTSIRKVAEKLQNLIYLDLRECYNLTDDSIKEVAKKLPHLIRLGLCECKKLTDISIKEVAEKLHNLTHLDLRGCKEITDDSIKEVAEKLHNLIHLDLRGCKEITDDSIKEVAEKLPHLTYLALARCRKLTDASIKKVAENLKNLNHLDLKECKKLTNASIQEVINKLNNLTRIDLGGCKEITNDFIQEVAKKLSFTGSDHSFYL